MSQLHQFIKRPGYGTEGKKLTLKVNYFEVKTFPEIVYHYDVSIIPTATPRISTILINELQNNNKISPQIMIVYDGAKNIFSSTPIPTKEFTEKISSSLNLRIAPSKPYIVKIVLVNTIHKAVLLNFISNINPDNHMVQNYLMCLNIAFKCKALHKYPVLKSSYFLPNENQEIYRGLKVHQGYFQSCRPTLKKLFLNVDTTSAVFYPEGSLINLVSKFFSIPNVENLKMGINQEQLSALSNFLIGIQIQIEYRQNRALRFKINSISQKSAQEVTFCGTNLEKTNVVNYFKEKYDITLKFPLLPCVVVKGDQHLPMELCKITPNQKFMKKLDERQVCDIAKFTCKKPDIKFNQIKNSNRSYAQDNEYLDNFNISVSNEFASTEARLLPPPSLNYLNKNNLKTEFVPNSGVWDMRGKKFVHGAVVNSWGILCLCHPKQVQKNQIDNFIKELIDVSSSSGLKFQIRSPPIEYGEQSKIFTVLQKLTELVQNSTKAYPQLFVCILPVKSTDLYADIKRIGDTVLGILTQCIISKNIFQPKVQYLSNVSLKINSKIGGVNTYLEPKSISFINNEPTMVLGADISNPGPLGKGASIASIVASLDRNFCAWCSKSCKQPPRESIIVDIKNMMKYILTKFKSQHKRLPVRIIFYRDGASEGQYSTIKELEIKGIRDAFAELGKTDVKVTFVVAVKRHHTKFLAPREFQDRSGNCLPGTIIDRNITHPNEFDFFLFSHSGIQGTSRPTHYHVLDDDNNFTADCLQGITYSLCYIQSRCTRSVSLTTPVYYAHLLGNRIRLHQHSIGITDDGFNESESRDVGVTKASQLMSSKLFFV